MSSLALSQLLPQYLVSWRQLAWPLAWDEVFGRQRPLALEIGFGNGAFLLEQAQRHPQRNHIGIELSWRSIQRLVQQLHRHHLKYVRALEGDAQYLLHALFPPASLDEVFVNFSDPWPKRHHHQRRLIQPEFVCLLSERLKLGAQVTIATDHAEYAAWIQRVLQAQAVLQSCFDEPVVHQLPGRIHTKYERKALEQGKRIHYFVWRKAANTAGPRMRKEKVDNVPNVLLQGAVSLDALLASLAPRSWQENRPEGDVVIKLREAFTPMYGADALLDVLVKEGAFSQQLGVLLSVRENGEFLVKPASLGYPRPTWGVKRALWLLVNELLQQHPQLRVLSSTVGHFETPLQELADE